MSDLNNYSVDDEMGKYIDAFEIKQANLGMQSFPHSPRRYNPNTNRNDVLAQMENGGYIKVGDEPVVPFQDAPQNALARVQENQPALPFQDAPANALERVSEPMLPFQDAPANMVARLETAAPEQPMMQENTDQSMVTPGASIESAMEYANFLISRGGETARTVASSLIAAGYSPEVTNAVLGNQAQENMPNEVTRTEPLSEQEVENILRNGGSVLGEYDPTIRETGRVELTQYLIELAEDSLAEDLRAQGFTENNIQRKLEAERPRIKNESRSLSGMFFGDETTFGIGVGDFVTAGIMDIQEGARLFKQGINSNSVADRSFGALLVLAGIAEATGVGMLVGKAIKKSIPAFRAGLANVGERLNQPGEMPTVGSNLGNVGQQTQLTTGYNLPGRISTRLPTAKQIDEDPLSGELIIGLEEMKKDPKLFDFNVSITKDYPNMRSVDEETIDATSERFIEHVKNNLLYLHDEVPEATRVRSRKWYDGARAITDRWSKEYDVSDTSIAGVLAGLSPQKDWYQNVSLAQRTLEVATKQKDFKFTKQMEKTFTNLPSLNKPKYKPILDAIKNKSYAEIVDENPAVQATLRAMFVRLYDQTYNKPDYKIVSPEGEFLEVATNADGTPSKAAWGSLNEIGKAVASIDAAGDVNTISRLMGERHKVRNFYNNIYDPNSSFGDVTIDTHAVAAGLLRPLSGNSLEVDHNFKNQAIKGRGTTKGSAKTGVSGNYGLYAEAYRRAAAEREILPRQMQSITWEAVRGLFPDKFKASAKNVADIDAIWQSYKNGDIELDETRRLVNERANGVNAPTWE